MKINKKTISIVLIQIFLSGNLGFAGSALQNENRLLQKTTLSPQIYIDSNAFMTGFQKQIWQKEEFAGEQYSFVLNNASELLTCTDVSQVQDIIEKVVDLLGFGRVKFYEVIRYDKDEKKWYIKQQIKSQSKGNFSERYLEEGPARDEKAYVLNKARKEGRDLYYVKNRWEHIIGDKNAKDPHVELSLIELDTAEFGEGMEQRVREFLHIVLRNSNGKILGILSVDKWQKPLASNPALSEPIFPPKSANSKKIKTLKMFAQLSGLALQRIRFKEKEEKIDELQESEAILREILHDIRNKIMALRGLLTEIDSKETKRTVRERANIISRAFTNISLRVKSWEGKLEVDTVLVQEGLVDKVFQVIEKTVEIIRSQDPEQVSKLFAEFRSQLKNEVRAAGGFFSPQLQDYFAFLNDFERLAVYQAGLFDRQEKLFLLHQDIQSAWKDIEKEIMALVEDREDGIDPVMQVKFNNIFVGYQEAQVEYEKYVELCKDLASNGFLQRSFDYQEVDIRELMDVINDQWLRNKLESSIKLEPYLPEVIVDKETFLSVFNELIMNAKKYGGRGAFIDISHDKKNLDFLRIEFTTRGRGISKAEWEKVFEDEYRVVKDDGQGTGLGLNIVKKNIARMGGKIWISKSRLQNDEFEGSTTFSILVPVADHSPLMRNDFLVSPLPEVNKVLEFVTQSI